MNVTTLRGSPERISVEIAAQLRRLIKRDNRHDELDRQAAAFSAQQVKGYVSTVTQEEFVRRRRQSRLDRTAWSVPLSKAST